MTEAAGTFLDDIVTARRRQIEEARACIPLGRLQEAAEARTERRHFASAISAGGLSIIAELKRASPSRGVLREQYSPVEIAKGYESAGAAALSVLTEERFFLGSLDDLARVRQATRLAVLRKDFIVEAYQVFESVAAGADALLLIVAALTDAELRGLIQLSKRLRIASLVEVHIEDEVHRAVEAGAEIIGVNNRNLKTLQVDLATSLRLRERIPSSCLAVSESGIKTAQDLCRLREAGFNAVLIGERLLVADDPGRELAQFLEEARILAAPRSANLE